MSKLQSLRFEVQYALRQMVREEGGAVGLVHSGAGQRLMQNLAAIEALKAAQKAA
jgi:hypothetical protein